MSPPPVTVALLGSTGSVGRQTLEVVAASGGRYRVVALAAGSDRESLEAQARAFDVSTIGLGADAAEEIAATCGADVVVNAIVGAAGLRASVAALLAGSRLALANKESLIAAGAICLRAATAGGTTITPVDSEHNAIAQLLRGHDRDAVERIILTASGGPFRNRRDLANVTPEEALSHPTWSMGPKITVDSATLMNKGFEIIEAHFLFGVDYDRIEVVVHPQSIVHGIVELSDGSTLMHAAPPDMKIPIASALEWPGVARADIAHVDLATTGSLTFEPVDVKRFPLLALARAAGVAGGTATAVLNAANEVAVNAFLARRLSFTGIAVVVESVMDSHEPEPAEELDVVLAADGWARAAAEDAIAREVVPA